jgi:hypothetical protein
MSLFRRRALGEPEEARAVPPPAAEERPGWRERRRWRAREAGAGAAEAVGAGFLLLARLIMTLAVLIALLIVAAIVLQDVGANPHNGVVEGVREGANFFAGAFTGMITFKGHPDRAITVNWGIAAAVFLIVGAIIAGFIRRIGFTGVSVSARRPALR